ncbi:cell division protein FtsZ [Mollicutes bacterium LVI A0039]|nr:cell division protein FtsZ [Mollicutes bacterium LVI A0039]
MKETQTTFEIFGDDTTSITLNNDVLDDLDDMVINDPKAGMEVDTQFEVQVETNVDSAMEDSLSDIDKHLNRLDDTLDLAQKEVELDFRESLTINTSDLSKMQEINQQIKVASESKPSEAISLSDGKDVFLTGAAGYGKVNILTLGIGGCGVNAIGRMYDERNSDIKLVAMDTSRKSLANNNADHKILLGEKTFKGHGSGGNYEAVANSINVEKEKIQQLLKDIDMLFITGGIGKGTGSVGLVEIGKIARQMGILTIGFAVLPTANEADGNVVKKYYTEFIDNVDSNIIVENQRVNEVYKHLPVLKAAKMGDKMLVDGIRGISDLITSPGKINLDYADVKTAFSNKGSVVMGIGYGKGENAVIDAINQSIKSDIINFNNVKNARDIIFNISCAKNTITIGQANKGTELIYSYNEGDQIDHLFFGYSYDETLDDEVKVTFVATGTGVRNLDDIIYKDNGTKAGGVATDLFGNPIPARPANNRSASKPTVTAPADASNTETKQLEIPDFFNKK